MTTTSDNAPTARILWTGGWDSTFRVLQALLLEHRTVQPIYVLSATRGSTMQELRAMELIRAAVLARLHAPGRLLATQVHIGAQYPPRAELVGMRESILRRGWIGEQYVNFAAVAEALDWQEVEMSLERHVPVPSIIESEFVGRDGLVRDTAEAALFSRFSYPVTGLTKRDMARVAQDHGFEDLLRMRWFCHQPIRDKPCGRCRPCRLAVREDVEFAHPALAATRAAYRRGRRLTGRPTS